MNKQEAIEIIEQSKIKIANRGRVIFKAGEIIAENVQVDYVPLEVVVNTIDQIHEPQKVVVPKFVAEWIEGCKRSGWHLQKALYRLDDDWKVGNWAYDDNDDLIPEKVDMIALAWLFGYEIEQEKLYTVEIPNPNNTSANVLCLRKDGGKIHISKQNHKTYKQSRYCHLTESEIKKDFEWAWQFAKEVE
ncbi:DUF1642 domain-containing protein [Streptococcus suis]|nr:DUF1642 domain-containing protein [Streptococcus suis]HEL1541860.1 DUF1642 domain-containing protein [Streptococcus suis]